MKGEYTYLLLIAFHIYYFLLKLSQLQLLSFIARVENRLFQI